MTRAQAINLVNLYDGIFPKKNLKNYLEYFNISELDFYKTIDKWVNKELFEKTSSGWKPKYKIS